ncbi:UNVERIFIED_CONTAM: hypothetical protein PYX00_009499 [Menopon gallinae]|uniref:Uncharacterized protein n=1 Tax=Menopon gallinae TaxID=328185 RepID=A0AAW2HBP1_9NEOP
MRNGPNEENVTTEIAYNKRCIHIRRTEFIYRIHVAGIGSAAELIAEDAGDYVMECIVLKESASRNGETEICFLHCR